MGDNLTIFDILSLCNSTWVSEYNLLSTLSSHFIALELQGSICRMSGFEVFSLKVFCIPYSKNDMGNKSLSYMKMAGILKVF